MVRAVLPGKRGVSRSSRDAGWDAVDAGRISAQILRGRVMRPRTAKAYGPGAPTLALSEQSDLLATGARQPGPRGEYEGNRNTIAQGRPGCFGRTCGFSPPAFLLLAGH